MQLVSYDRLILATGASDRVAPVPGWQSAGVYSLGAAQIALKAQGVALGHRIVLIGSGPLLTLVGAQLVKAGADVAAVLDTSPWHQQMRGFWKLAARPFVALRGLALRVRLGRRYHAGVSLERIEADGQGITAICWRDAGGRQCLTPCDTIGMGWHLRAETHLADLAGCAFTYDEQWRQWLPKTDRMGRAGNRSILRVTAFVSSGRMARRSRGVWRGGVPCRSWISGALHRGGSARACTARALCARPGLRLSWPAAMVRALPDDAIVCRCENVAAGDVRQSVDSGGGEVNRVKSLSRVGMGRCQGRYCQLAAVELVAEQAGCAADAVGRFRGQAPVRPAPVGAFLREGGCDCEDSASASVTS